MKTALRFPALFLLAIPLAAQIPTDNSSGKPSEKASIEGVVKAGPGGEPLRKVRLTLRQVDGRDPVFGTAGAITDAEGHFLFKDIEPGRYHLRADRNGYLSQDYGQRGRTPPGPGTMLTVERGQRLRDIVFPLTPTAVITGRVVDEDNEPLVDVAVQALRYTYHRGRRQLTSARMAVTNDRGEFRIHNLGPGRYYISATYTAGIRSIATLGERTIIAGQPIPEQSYAPIYYPGTIDSTEASEVAAVAGAEVRGIDIKLVPTPAVRVRGRVINTATGRPARSGTVFLMPRDVTPFMEGAPQGRGSVHGEGEFEIPAVMPGSYALVAELFGQGERYSGHVLLEVGKTNLEGVTVIISRGLPVTGKVRVEGNTPVSLNELTIEIEPRGPFPAGYGTQLAADGSFTLQGIPPDAYRIRLSGTPGDIYLRAARLGDREVLEAGLDLSHAESASGPLELLLASGAGRLEGVVLDERQNPASGAQVVLIPESSRRDQSALYKNTTADQNGHFTLSGIAPGEYKVFAWEDVETGAYQDADFLRPYEGRGEACKIDRGSAKSLQLQVIPAEAAR